MTKIGLMAAAVLGAGMMLDDPLYPEATPEDRRKVVDWFKRPASGRLLEAEKNGQVFVGLDLSKSLSKPRKFKHNRRG